MKKKALLILAGCLLLFGTSCYYDSKVEYDDGDNGGGVPPPEDEISFAESILPIIEDYNCAGCHGGGLAPDLRSENAYNSLLNGYVVPDDAGASVLFQRMPGKNHPGPPPPALTAEEQDLIEAWINRGALE